MEITEIQVDGYERVAKAQDPESGLHALIAVHDTTLGPALGGMRMWPYASEQDALYDVLRLSKGMSYKSAIAHTGLGGGKAVVIGDPAELKSEKLFLAMGRFVDAFNGKYITAEDVNIAVADLEIVRRATKYVTGLELKDGGSGNPSPYTAYGTFLGLVEACKWKFGTDDLTGRTVAVQGVGAVGGPLVERLVEAGAKVTITDSRQDRVTPLVEKLGVSAVTGDEIYDVNAEVFAPCALGAIINDDTIKRLKCKVIAGAANNVLHEERHGQQLYEMGILYAPDYVINAGGIVNVSVEFHDGGYDQDVAIEKIRRIPEALREIWTISEAESIPSSAAADRLARNILAEGKAKANR